MQAIVRRRLLDFLEEDLGRGDVTSEAVVPAHTRAVARLMAREAGILAGGTEAVWLAELGGLSATLEIEDGEPVEDGDRPLRLEGAVRGLLAVERTLVNLVAHMSGVATMTRRAVEAVAGTGARIAATRKTLPGLRWFQKKAVRLGGGDPHRHDLSDAVMIKDNHLRIAPGLSEAVDRAREAVSFTHRIEVEVEDATRAVEAARAGADILLLDNMGPEGVAGAVEKLRGAGLREHVLLEASGGIGLDDLPAYARTGVDVISMGTLTSSAPALDFSMELVT